MLETILPMLLKNLGFNAEEVMTEFKRTADTLRSAIDHFNGRFDELQKRLDTIEAKVSDHEFS